MAASHILPGDTVFVRAEALSVGGELIELRIDDGRRLGLTLWVPAGECGRLEDLGGLAPQRRRGPR